jgi:hypothetical protein
MPSTESALAGRAHRQHAPQPPLPTFSSATVGSALSLYVAWAEPLAADVRPPLLLPLASAALPLPLVAAARWRHVARHLGQAHGMEL